MGRAGASLSAGGLRNRDRGIDVMCRCTEEQRRSLAEIMMVR